MKIVIGQPVLEETLLQLEQELMKSSADILLYPEGYLNQNVKQASQLVARYETMLVTGHRRLNERPKDRSIIINKHGKIVLEKAKYTPAEVVENQGWRISTLLCDELVLQGFVNEEVGKVDILMHSIGVGMFSEEQYEEWIQTARNIAIQNECIVMGCSHADGSYRNCGVSIPIAYCIAPDGEVVLASKNDTRTRTVILKANEEHGWVRTATGKRVDLVVD